MKMISKMSMMIAMFALAMGMQIAVAADMKVAVVNVQEVLQQSPRVASLSKKLESRFKARQAKITDEQKKLQDQLEKFKKESPTMSNTDREKMQKQITDDRSGLVKQVMAYQQDLQTEQNKIMQDIIKELNGVVSSIAKNGSYSLVLDSQAVIFSNDTKDLTKDVAKQFNKNS